MSGYRRTGQFLNALDTDNYCIDPLNKNAYYKNFDAAMQLCTMIKGQRMTSAQLQDFKSALIPAIQIFKLRGRITEEEMDELNLLNVTNGKVPKDQRSLHQQRSSVMTAHTVMQQHQEKQQVSIAKKGTAAANAATRVTRETAS